MSESYRDSHLTKGKEYDYVFRKNEYLRTLWQFESEILVSQAKVFEKKQNTNFLDFACGTCRVAELLEEYFQNSIGVDVSDEMMAIGRHKLSKTQLIKVDITQEKLPFPAQFDLIVAFRFFAGAENALQETAIIELEKLLKPNGVLIFNNHRNYGSTFFSIQRMFYKMNNRAWTVRCLNESRARHLGRMAGHQLAHVYHWGVLPNDESKQVIPHVISKLLENIFAKIGFLRSKASSQIYIFKKPSF